MSVPSNYIDTNKAHSIFKEFSNNNSEFLSMQIRGSLLRFCESLISQFERAYKNHICTSRSTRGKMNFNNLHLGDGFFETSLSLTAQDLNLSARQIANLFDKLEDLGFIEFKKRLGCEKRQNFSVRFTYKFLNEIRNKSEERTEEEKEDLGNKFCVLYGEGVSKYVISNEKKYNLNLTFYDNVERINQNSTRKEGDKYKFTLLKGHRLKTLEILKRGYIKAVELGFRTEEGGFYTTFEDLTKLSGMAESTVKRHLKLFLEAEILDYKIYNFNRNYTGYERKLKAKGLICIHFSEGWLDVEQAKENVPAGLDNLKYNTQGVISKEEQAFWSNEVDKVFAGLDVDFGETEEIKEITQKIDRDEEFNYIVNSLIDAGISLTPELQKMLITLQNKDEEDRNKGSG